jgi:ribosomal protein S18 acetylase RimI-like enzyme
MEIRRLGLRDAADYRTLRLRSFMEHPEAFTTSYDELGRESLEDTEERLRTPHMKFWGAFNDEKLFGYVGLDRETRQKCRHKARLIGMYVERESAGRGAGRMLVETLLREGREEGIELVVLTVTEGDNPAVRLYEHCGFQSFGIEPRAIKVGGSYYDKNHMFIELRPPS